MKKHTLLFYSVISFSTILILALIATVAFAGGLALAPQLTDLAQAAPPGPLSQPAVNPPIEDEIDVLTAYEAALTRIYETTLPSVVRIDVTQQIDRASQFDPRGPRSPFPPFSPFALPQTPETLPPLRGEGSGFVWDDEGHIVTNYHVVKDADRIEVTFADGTNVEAELVGADPNADLAVLKVDRPAAELYPIALGDSDDLAVGQLAIAIGNPFGQEFTMTSGIISALGRTIPSGLTLFSIPEAIQTDAPMNPGNSGGPLLNHKGEVIGINTQILSRSGASAGIGFAVPINIAKQVVPTLIAGQEYEYAWLGISGGDLTDDIAELMDLPEGAKGALVISVAQDSPADKAGLRGSDKTLSVAGQSFPFGGDVITAIDGQPVEGIEDVIIYLVEKTRPGDEVTLDVIRANGDTAQITVTLGSRPK